MCYDLLSPFGASWISVVSVLLAYERQIETLRFSTVHLRLALKVLRCKMCLNSQCPAVLKMLGASRHPWHIYELVVIIHPATEAIYHIKGRAFVCWRKSDNSSWIASVCTATLPFSYLSRPGAMQGTKVGERFNSEHSLFFHLNSFHLLSLRL